ncbi:DUF5675 family protein [Pseudodesulfovibrio pelocollis]|uniref:DUF5675 family protein n=1 Tax=Pseudodesulfovibrio pelocollis TaxID=3051432 RepID=UPI00255B0175|nr:DUF5675 family protein [Pseudodesulfovibrio sp. SB368]
MVSDPVELFKLGAPLHELVAAAKIRRERMGATLIRYDEDRDGTFGVLIIDGRPFCSTLEPPDLNNAANISCIPPGVYTCGIVDSPRYGRTFEVQDVPGRTHILIHSGNIVAHTMGCILLGQYVGKLKGDRAVLNSGATFSRFMAQMSGLTEFRLTILETAGLAS